MPSTTCPTQSYKHYSDTKSILIADGRSIKVAGDGSVDQSLSIFISNSLCAPKSSINLLSIHQITKSLNCLFLFISLIVWSKTKGKMIRYGKERNGLYYLESTSEISNEKSQYRLSLTSLSQSLSSSVNNKMLECFRLGHPICFVKSIISTSLGVSMLVFQIPKSCKLAKHHRVSFPVVKNVSVIPFLQYDIWGP